MGKATALTREKSVAQDNISNEISKAGVGVIGVTSVLIGCWAVVVLISGMMSSGGPAGLVSNFITAIAG